MAVHEERVCPVCGSTFITERANQGACQEHIEDDGRQKKSEYDRLKRYPWIHERRIVTHSSIMRLSTARSADLIQKILDGEVVLKSVRVGA